VLTVNVLAGTNVDVGAIQNAIADKICSLGFRSSLPASYIVETAHGLLPATASVNIPIDMFGQLITPASGATITYRSGTLLSVVESPLAGISSNTVMFFASPADITVSVNTL
jgi:hypothetical protein